jgi:hypothetical protein
MGIDGHALHPFDHGLAQCALNRGASLAFPKHDRLVVEDRPLVQYMGIGSDRRPLTPWIEPGVSEEPGGIQAHHVGRSVETASPEVCDTMPAHEANDGVIGEAKAYAAFEPLDDRPDHVRLDTRHHAIEGGDGQVRSQGQERGVQRDQFRCRLRGTSQQCPGEAGVVVDIDENV